MSPREHCTALPRHGSGGLSYNALRKTIKTRTGNAVEHSVSDGVNYIIGNLWTARQRQGHSIHEISYRACFKPQLPEFLLNILTQPSQVVLDPFLGRGTTAIQAALMGRVAYGSDVNPLSVMLTRPRLATPLIDDVDARLRKIPLRAEVSEEDNILTAFYHPQVLEGLVAMKKWFLRRERQQKIDAVDEWIRMVATNRLTGHSPGFFSVKTMPPNQAVSVEVQRGINKKNKQTPPPRNIADIIMKKTASLLRSGAVGGNQRHKLFYTDAANLFYARKNTVDAVITSPPFLDMVDYHKDNWLRCWFNGIEQGDIKISRHNNIGEWQKFVYESFSEFARVVKPGGYVAFEVGEAHGGKILLEQLVIEAVADLPFSFIAVLVNQQDFTKTANCWGVDNNSKGTNTNRIVLFSRH